MDERTKISLLWRNNRYVSAEFASLGGLDGGIAEEIIGRISMEFNTRDYMTPESAKGLAKEVLKSYEVNPDGVDFEYRKLKHPR